MEAIASTTKELISTQFQFGYYANLAGATNLPDLKKQISQTIKRLGLSEFSITRLSCSPTPQPELNTLPDAMMEEYYDASLYCFDMNRQRASENTEPFFHSTIHEYIAKAPFNSKMTRRMQDIYLLGKNYGYYDFYSIPLEAKQYNDTIMFTVTRRGFSPVELKCSVIECSTDLQLLAEAIEFVISHNFSDEIYHCAARAKTAINAKPLRVLDTLANNDLTINQVADKLCISVVTANQHLKTVRKSLGTHTNYAAIKKAIMIGLIRYKNEQQSNTGNPSGEITNKHD